MHKTKQNQPSTNALAEEKEPMVLDDTIITADFKDYELYGVGKFDLLLSDIPYALGSAAYGSNPMWYKKGDNKKGVSELAGRPFFQTDGDFDLDSYARVCAALLKPSTGKPGEDGCVITFCSFEQQVHLISAMKEHGFKGYIPLSFVKKSSPQALKANQRYCGATEHAIVSYRGKLPLWRNGRQMVLDWMPWPAKDQTRLHPTQKPQALMEELIRLHTKPGMRVCDLTCGSGTTCAAAKHLGRHYLGFEIDSTFAKLARQRCTRETTVMDLLETLEAA